MKKEERDGWNENDTMLPQDRRIENVNLKEWDEWDEPAEKKLTATELYKLEMADRRKDQSER